MSGDSNALDPVAQGALRPIVYDIDKSMVDALLQKYADLQADTTEGYEEVRLAIADVRGKRTAVDKRRKELKAEALEFGRKVDGAAAVLTDALLAIEEPLKAKRDAADAEKERKRRAAAEAELVATEARLKAEREAAEAKAKAEREAEEKRLADERARHEADRAAFAQQQAEADKKRAEEQAKLDADRAALAEQQRVIDEQQAATARAEQERLARIKAEDDARAKAEADRQAKIRAEDEERAEAERKRIAAEQAARAAADEELRLEALRPEIERVRAWAPYLRAMALESAPGVESGDAVMAVGWAQEQIENVARVIEKFTPRKKGA